MKKSEIKIGQKVRNRISRSKGVVIDIPVYADWVEVRIDRGNANHLKAKWMCKNIELIQP